MTNSFVLLCIIITQAARYLYNLFYDDLIYKNSFQSLIKYDNFEPFLQTDRHKQFLYFGLVK